MLDAKPILQSRTVWANAVGLLALVLGLMGAPLSDAESAGLAEALGQLVAAGSFVASTLFRILATSRLASG